MTDFFESAALTPRDRADILLAEYSALYDLVTFRMSALDRRVPAAGATLLAFTGSAPLLPGPAQITVLAAIPASLVWLLRTTINHARSFEDVLRRIEQIESKLNAIAEEELLRFQSSHPSRLRAVGGRTGTETVLSVVLAGAILLLAAAVSMVHAGVPVTWVAWYLGYLVSTAGYLAWLLIGWTRYRSVAGVIAVSDG